MLTSKVMFHSQPAFGRRKPDCWNRGRAAERPGTVAGIHVETAFHIEAVRFATGERTLLGPVSLELERSRVYGLIGHNGSGKSTLIKLLARQQPASSGAITFAQRPLAQWG